MKWQFGFNPNAPYNSEMYPDSTQYDPKPREVHPSSSQRVQEDYDIGFGTWVQAMLGMVLMIFLIKFFFLIVAPLIPISVIAYEMMDELLVKKIVIVYGVSFVVAYLAYWWYKSYFVLLSGFLLKSIYFVGIYAFNIWATFFLMEIYPENTALQGLVEEFGDVVAFFKPYFLVLSF